MVAWWYLPGTTINTDQYFDHLSDIMTLQLWSQELSSWMYEAERHNQGLETGGERKVTVAPLQQWKLDIDVISTVTLL